MVRTCRPIDGHIVAMQKTEGITSTVNIKRFFVISPYVSLRNMGAKMRTDYQKAMHRRLAKQAPREMPPHFESPYRSVFCPYLRYAACPSVAFSLPFPTPLTQRRHVEQVLCSARNQLRPDQIIA